MAVDVTGSAALCGAPGRRLIPGVGASRRSLFLTPDDYDRAVLVEDAEAIAVCRNLRDDLGLALGGPRGCAVRALLADTFAEGSADFAGRHGGLPVCLAADGGDKYLRTLYSDEWATEQGIREDMLGAVKQLRYEGLRFSWELSA